MFWQTPTFWIIFVIGIALVALQGVLAYADDYFSPAQIRAQGIIGYSILEHGGWWSDIFVVTPAVAYIASAYRLPYFSLPSLAILLIAIAVIGLAGIQYQKMALLMPEAHTHDGYTTPAGWIHGLYALAAIWICGMFYFTHVEPQRGWDMLLVSFGLTALFILGVMKFSPHWHWDTGNKIQVIGLIAATWGVTAFHLVQLLK